MDRAISKLLFTLFLFSFFLGNPLSKIFSYEKKIIYKIKYGDTLSEIAQDYNVSVKDLKRWNKITSSSKIYAGKKIKIYRPSTGHSSRSVGIYPSHKYFYTPVHNGRIIRKFNPFGDSKNLGIVYRIQNKSIVKSSSSGEVIKVDYMRGYGHYVLVDHGSGWISMYSNLWEIYVRKGQKVSKKQKIGLGKNNFFFLISYKGEPVNPLSVGLKRS